MTDMLVFSLEKAAARAKVLLGVCGCLGLLGACISEKVDDEPQPDIVHVGDSLPDFSVRMDDGQTVTTGDLRGKVAFILFFTTSCPDCRKELPVVQQVYDRYGADARLRFVSVSREEEASSIAGYWAEQGLSLPYSAQTDRAVYNLFAYSSIPRIYITDTASVVRAVYTDSPLATLDDLVRDIESVLPPAP